jgi:hypothetical protein
MDRKVTLPVATLPQRWSARHESSPRCCVSRGVDPPMGDVDLGGRDQIAQWIWGLMTECAA